MSQEIDWYGTSSSGTSDTTVCTDHKVGVNSVEYYKFTTKAGIDSMEHDKLATKQHDDAGKVHISPSSDLDVAPYKSNSDWADRYATAKKQLCTDLLMLNKVDAKYIRRRIAKNTIQFPYQCSINNNGARYAGYLCRHGVNIFFFIDGINSNGPNCLFSTGKTTFVLEDLFAALHSNEYTMRKV